MRKPLAIFTLIAILAPISGRAEDPPPCVERRLDRPGESMANISIYDQGPADICYAYTASQLIDAYRQSHPQLFANAQEPSSPLAIAVAFAVAPAGHAERTRPGIDMGDSRRAILSVQSASQRVCSQKAMDRQFSTDTSGVNEVGRLLFFWEMRQDARKGHNQELADLAVEATRCVSPTGSANRSLVGQISNLAQAMDAATGPRYLNEVVGAACRNNYLEIRNLPVPSSLTVHQGGNPSLEGERQFVRRLRTMFSAPNAQPIGIGYCADFLQNSRLQINAFRNPSPDGKSAEGCQLPHQSVVIGSRSRNGQCEYLIRNTLGKTCENYDRAWECDPARGQLWVSESSLVGNTDEVTWLEPRERGSRPAPVQRPAPGR